MAGLLAMTLALLDRRSDHLHEAQTEVLRAEEAQGGSKHVLHNIFTGDLP